MADNAAVGNVAHSTLPSISAEVSSGADANVANQSASSKPGGETGDEEVEEKFEKYFGYLARCEGKFCI